METTTNDLKETTDELPQKNFLKKNLVDDLFYLKLNMFFRI